MAQPARQQGEQRPPRPRLRRPPIVYVVEVAPGEPDPRVEAKVLEWLRTHLG